MSIASVLIQPQRVRRNISVSKEAALVEDLARVALRLLSDPDEAQQILAILEETIDETADRFRVHVSARINTAYQRLQDLIQPVTDTLQSFDFDAIEGDPDAIGQLAQTAFDLLVDLVKGLSLDALRRVMAELVDILENDLGVTGSFIEDELWAFVDRIIDRLRQIPGDLPSDIRENRLEIAATLSRAKRLMQQSFKFPEFDPERLAKVVLDIIRKSGFEDIRSRIECAAGNLNDAVESASTLNDLLNNSGPQNIGAAAANSESTAGTYGWYATWLLQHKYRDIPLFKPDDLKDAKSLANKLKSPVSTDEVSIYLRSELPEADRAALDEFDGTSEPDDNLKNIILALLNKVIQENDLDLQHEFTFENVSLSEAAIEVRNGVNKNQEIVRFNRMFLEDIYPQEFERIPRSFGDCFWAAVWEGIKETVGWPGEQVRISDDGKHVLLGDKIMHTGSNVKWQDSPIFDTSSIVRGQKYYKFAHISPDFLEGWAWHSTWANDAIRAVWHLLNIRATTRAHFLPSLFNGAYDVGHGLTSVIARKPFSGFNFFSHKWLEWGAGLPLALTTLGSPQGAHTTASFKNGFAFWLTVWLGDIINYVGPVSATSALRELTLTFMTSLNFRGPQNAPSTVPEHSALNYKELDGIVDPVVTAFTYWFASEVEREEYVHPFFPGDVPGRVWALWLAGGAGMGLFAGLVGALIAEITAWAEDWKLLGLTMLKKIPSVIFQFWPILYSLREGDTDGGRFNPLGGIEFTGYPQKETNGAETPSPYLLPYEAGKIINVGQGNLGAFSHNPRANKIHTANPNTMQTYAYDFALDQAEEILASRPGTIIDYFEWVPDDTEPSANVPAPAGAATGPTTSARWNFVTIRHDVDDNGNPVAPDNNHDLDIGGTVTRTFAVYGHGRMNGVTDALARWDTPPATIVGTLVKQGQPIILAGDTGVSFYNHLHMHILPGANPAAANPNNAYAIPFIFQDVEGDGVCKALHWYESANPRVTA